jgi:formylglycine-generating enzyme required for sulfatase activity
MILDPRVLRSVLSWLIAITCSVAWTNVTSAAQNESADTFTIRADWFDRGNVRVSVPGEPYADRFACIWNGGPTPNQAEYDLDFPVTANYKLSVLYTAQQSRPVNILLDGTVIQQGLAGTTGSWSTSQATWEYQGTIRISKGRHTIGLSCPGPCICHVCALRFKADQPFPRNWTLSRPVAARKRPVARPKQATAHLIPAIPGLGWKELTIVHMQRAEDSLPDDMIGPPRHNELVDRTPDLPRTEATPTFEVKLQDSDGREHHALVTPDVDRLRRMLQQTARLIDDFATMSPDKKVQLEQTRNQTSMLRHRLEESAELPEGDTKWTRLVSLFIQVSQWEHQVALRNPLLDFKRLLYLRRRVVPGNHGYAGDPYGLPYNWQSNSSIRNDVWDNEIRVLESLDPVSTSTVLYKPTGPHFVGDVDLHFSAEKMLFSSVGSNGQWQVFEMREDGTGLRQVTPDVAGVNNYDPCYLPDGRILFTSTASMAAVPCVNGSSLVANLYRIDADGKNIRQLCFDQEHNWCPTIMPDGRVLYLRWEYTDTPHAHDRILFQMNPDGTGQREFYGGNSYWPNSLFYARPIPHQATMFLGIVSGHHGVRRMGELVLFDAARGHHEADGVIQRIPGRGQAVAPLIEDQLVDHSWPKFLHPWPLNDKYFLVAAQPTAKSSWGIYLADIFDNLLLLKEEPGYALLEPIPFCPQPTPPIIPDRARLDQQEAIVHMSDVYAGRGLKGIPRGTVKQLRVISYSYLYPGMGGPQGVVGMEGPWDIKRIIGTVPVEEDGSAVFRIPADTPIAVQPLDADGKALQLMRSWFTGMPGEVVTCVGCHESRLHGPPSKSVAASHRVPVAIQPWYGPPRGFSFKREVQPILDQYCISCHGGPQGDPSIADLRGLEQITDYTSAYHYGGDDAGRFSTSYVELHRFVRRPGLESDYHILMPMEFHADTTQLVQLLQQGHHDVQLDDEAWNRLITWIDLNAPYHGTWTEVAGPNRVASYATRRRELARQYNGLDIDLEWIPPVSTSPPSPISRPHEQSIPASQEDSPTSSAVMSHIRPDTTQRTSRRVQASQTIRLPGNIPLKLVLIPAGEFLMGDRYSSDGRQSPHWVRIHHPFWMGELEVTNQQFAAFDPTHDSRVESRFGMQFGVRGFYVNRPKQPVVRVNWHQAMAFCDWLSQHTKRRFSLPTEAQWEYACRAATTTPFFYGNIDTDFSPFANLADATLSEFVCHPYKKEREPLLNRSKYDDWIPKDSRFDDGGFLSDAVGRYRPNPWGLYDMHGNVAEWTRSAFWAYPYQDDDGRNDLDRKATQRVVRGGSWRDRPARARAGFRLGYREYQPVYNVGFRVICAVDDPAK